MRSEYEDSDSSLILTSCCGVRAVVARIAQDPGHRHRFSRSRTEKLTERATHLSHDIVSLADSRLRHICRSGSSLTRAQSPPTECGIGHLRFGSAHRTTEPNDGDR